MELGLGLAQSQTLTPRMELSVRILQMDCAQLTDYLKEVMLENPVIEFEQPREQDDKHALALRKLEWLENQQRHEKENVGYYSEENDLTLEKTAGAEDEESLVEHLLAQVGLCAAAPELLLAARYVVGCIDENGYLTATREELAAELRIAPPLLDEAIALVQTFDPAGVGAADLRECLLLQLPQDDLAARRLVECCLAEIAANKSPAILARRANTPEAAVADAVARIRRLNPKPGALYAPRTAPAYITPDVVVTAFEDCYHVMLCEFSYPEIRLSAGYLKMARESSDKEVVSYIAGKASQVNWIKTCIENRNKTLLAVARAIVERQERFFRYGPQHLNILRMRDVAELVGLHESTISRAVRDKYLQCAYGVYPLRHFFVKGLDGGAGATSSHDAKGRLRALIEGETTPHSDQKLAELLAAEGITISRRTVAKYREELGFPSSTERSKGE